MPPTVIPSLPLPDGRSLSLARPVIVGVLNVTPDSFSDGGQWPGADAAVARGQAMLEEGADVIDVGGESTRPGSEPVPAAEQVRRTLPVVRRLCAAGVAGALRPAVSIDTRLAEVARAALDAGAMIINDVSAGSDPAMFALAAERRAGLVLMHMRGTPATMQQAPCYADVVGEVRRFLLDRAAAAEAAGVPRAAIVLDPGLGFGKTTAHNLMVLARLRELVATGYPLMVGASRKRFLGEILGGGDAARVPPPERAAGTLAVTALAVAAGARLVRVHDVKANRQAADVAWAVVSAGPGRAVCADSSVGAG